MMKTSMWSCGSSPPALTDSLRYLLHLCPGLRVTSEHHRLCKDVSDVNEPSSSSVPVAPSWVSYENLSENLDFTACSLLTPYVDLSFAKMFLSQIRSVLFFFVFFLLSCVNRTLYSNSSWESCCIAVSSPPIKRKHYSESLRAAAH